MSIQTIRTIRTDEDARVQTPGKHALPPLLKPLEVATTLNISQRSLWRLVSSGRLPQPDVRSGRIVRWKRETILAWVEGQAT